MKIVDIEVVRMIDIENDTTMRTESDDATTIEPDLPDQDGVRGRDQDMMMIMMEIEDEIAMTILPEIHTKEIDAKKRDLEAALHRRKSHVP